MSTEVEREKAREETCPKATLVVLGAKAETEEEQVRKAAESIATVFILFSKGKGGDDYRFAKVGTAVISMQVE